MKPIRNVIAGIVSSTATASGVAEGRMQGVVCRCMDYVYRRRFLSLIAGVALVFTAVLVFTYSAAATLVNDAAPNSFARTSYALAGKQAAANYRKARLECQRLPASAWSACISEAHAEENLARAVISPASRSYLASLRIRTDAGIDAGDRDAIIIEPACSVVTRGHASVCEIQVRNPGNALADATANQGGIADLTLLQAHAGIYGEQRVAGHGSRLDVHGF